MTSRAAAGISAAVVLLAAPLILIGLLIGANTALTGNGDDLNLSGLPPLAAQMAPMLRDLLNTRCPDLPLAWPIAITQVESGWNPHAYNPTGHADGLLQLTQPTWIGAGGRPWSSDPPPDDADVFQPVSHLTRGVDVLCANLHAVTDHLAAIGTAADPLDGLLVCHVAGCSRVLHSRTGTPAAGEDGCNATCAATVHRYIADVHTVIDQIGQQAGPVPIDDLPTATPFAVRNGGCTEPDPSSHGCLTPTMRQTLQQILATFGAAGPSAPIHSFACWDLHAWNPTSDHPKGRACDLFPTHAGTFPAGQELTNGWRIASWLRANADALHVKYLIWQGRYWAPDVLDTNGAWGEPYDGAGIYNIHDATGGHFDHIHVSVDD